MHFGELVFAPFWRWVIDLRPKSYICLSFSEQICDGIYLYGWLNLREGLWGFG